MISNNGSLIENWLSFLNCGITFTDARAHPFEIGCAFFTLFLFVLDWSEYQRQYLLGFRLAFFPLRQCLLMEVKRLLQDLWSYIVGFRFIFVCCFILIMHHFLEYISLRILITLQSSENESVLFIEPRSLNTTVSYICISITVRLNAVSSEHGWMPFVWKPKMDKFVFEVLFRGLLCAIWAHFHHETLIAFSS